MKQNGIERIELSWTKHSTAQAIITSYIASTNTKRISETVENEESEKMWHIYLYLLNEKCATTNYHSRFAVVCVLQTTANVCSDVVHCLSYPCFTVSQLDTDRYSHSNIMNIWSFVCVYGCVYVDKSLLDAFVWTIFTGLDFCSGFRNVRFSHLVPMARSN